MPHGAFKPEIKEALTVAPEVVYSPTVLSEFVTNRFVPETAIPKISFGSETRAAFTMDPDVV